MQCKETDDGLPLKENDDGDKTNWLSSVQLWNSDFNIVDHNKKPNTVSELKLQLGGSQVATPKQIKEVMQVDDLTNDEVKSHLQKYRLHIRKLPPSSTRNQCSENMKSQSGSPQCPLTVSALAKGMSSTGGDSMDGEEDEKSDGLSWRSGVHKPGEIECIVR
ncbi:Two-component response regulator ARR1 [Gossypium arboreum]|uniref:Two-component response regulator ARR1 n=1 Tax=Gossypium arboreum TaxID=29729 RepID=A0A0B0N2V5_GOSAR|nr:Two-component response regulator ARR1 [Gossypium arboreum]